MQNLELTCSQVMGDSLIINDVDSDGDIEVTMDCTASGGDIVYMYLDADKRLKLRKWLQALAEQEALKAMGMN